MENYRSPGLLRIIVAALAVFSGLFVASLYSFHLFHVLAELFSIVVACGIFMVAWNTRRISQNSYILFLGIAYLNVAFLDLLHTLSYKGLGVFQGITADVPTQFWIAGRYMEAISLLLAAFFIRRRFHPALTLVIFLVVSALLTVMIAAGWFPPCYQEGSGVTTFKTVSEFVISWILLIAIAAIWRKREEFDLTVLRLMTFAMILTVAAEISFSFYVGLFGLINQLGHYLKFVSFYLIYRATIESTLTRPYELMFNDLRKSQRDLAQSKERLRAVFMGIPIPTLTWERFQEEFRLAGANQAAEDISQGKASKLKNLPAEAFFNKRPEVLRDLGAAFSGQTIIRRELAGLPPFTGPGLSLEATYAYVPRDMVLMHLEDVTERKKAAALRADMERITRHDLKSPLNAIIGLPQALKMDNGLSLDQREQLDIIQESGQQLLGMINLSLDILRMEDGSYEMELKPVDLLEAARTVCNQHQGLARSKSIDLEASWASEAGGRARACKVMGEESLLRTMVGNLVQNALEASPAGQAVLVELIEAGGSVELSVINQREAPPEIRDTFFEKFVTQGKEGGTGLGTYAARLIAGLVGGEIGLDTSQPGQTRVWVRLPKARAEKQPVSR